MSKPRVSLIARTSGVLSKDIIEIANMTGQSIKSASTGIDINRDNYIYWGCVIRAAQRRRG